MNNENEYYSYDRNLKFHCPENHKLTQVDYCQCYCKKKNTCDIYATMLDEIYKK